MADDKEEITYELECTECGAEYEIVGINTSKNEPIYCPYCGADIDLDDLEKKIISEYYQRCFGEDLPESSINVSL